MSWFPVSAMKKEADEPLDMSERKKKKKKKKQER
jgi:hypothetical protein